MSNEGDNGIQNEAVIHERRLHFASLYDQFANTKDSARDEALGRLLISLQPLIRARLVGLYGSGMGNKSKDIDDITQESLMHIAHGLTRTDEYAFNSTLTEEQKANAETRGKGLLLWAYGVARNVGLTSYRDYKHDSRANSLDESRVGVDEGTVTMSQSRSPEAGRFSDEFERKVDAAIAAFRATLSSRDQEYFDMRDKGASIAEIFAYAHAHGGTFTEENTLRQLLNRRRLLLEKFYLRPLGLVHLGDFKGISEQDKTRIRKRVPYIRIFGMRYVVEDMLQRYAVAKGILLVKTAHAHQIEDSLHAIEEKKRLKLALLEEINKQDILSHTRFNQIQQQMYTLYLQGLKSNEIVTYFANQGVQVSLQEIHDILFKKSSLTHIRTALSKIIGQEQARKFDPLFSRTTHKKPGK